MERLQTLERESVRLQFSSLLAVVCFAAADGKIKWPVFVGQCLGYRVLSSGNDECFDEIYFSFQVK